MAEVLRPGLFSKKSPRRNAKNDSLIVSRILNYFTPAVFLRTVRHRKVDEKWLQPVRLICANAITQAGKVKVNNSCLIMVEQVYFWQFMPAPAEYIRG